MYKTDIQIAQEAKLADIRSIADFAGIDDKYLVPFGDHRAKIDTALVDELKEKKDGKLILVTAITPTPAGEGKTTTSIGLADGLQEIGKRAAVVLREPSLGPVFGMKGGAAGGGYAQVAPMEDINLHFNGDFHAISSANNLLAAMIDNHIYQGNSLLIDPKQVTWRRCMDMNDRQLRRIVGGLGARVDGVPREDGFDITAASEVMAVLCMSNDPVDLKQRLARIVIGYSYDGLPIIASDLNAHGAMAVLLKDAVKPNLVQTLEQTPALIHGGPFANIAHGCNSIAATKMALKLSDYVVTEAGFGADLGAEKFIDIKCRAGGLKPDAVVLVATVRALKHHGGAAKGQLSTPDLEKLRKGFSNLKRHVENVRDVFKLPVVVAINRFPTDSEEELSFIVDQCNVLEVAAMISTVWESGGKGGAALAEKVASLCEKTSEFNYCYPLEWPVEDKLKAVARRIYKADDVIITDSAKAQLEKIEAMGFGSLPVCIAKTQYSFSDNPSLTGAPNGFNLTVRNIKLSAGAGFIVALTGEIMTMPGLPKRPSAFDMDILNDGKITGLF